MSAARHRRAGRGSAWALAAAMGASAAARADTPPPGNPELGKAVYAACLGCHSIDEDDVGPRHRGVVGRTAGTVPGFAYSAALRNSGLVWDEATLDRWLADPQALVPGSRMFFALANASDRRNVIAYLRTLTVKDATARGR